MDINGLAAIVTGGGSGLGAETARQLAAKGAKVALFDVNMDGANAVAQEIGGIAIECDVTSDEGVASAIAQAQAANGVARIVINAAGIAPAKRIIDREGNATSLDYFRKGIEINLVGAYNVMSKAAAEMSKVEPVNADNERGIVISTGSIATQEGQIGQASYLASKMGLMGMMLPAAREFTRFGIRVNTINPGVFETPMLTNMPQEVQDSLGKQVPFPVRLGTPDEYARLAIHMIENAYINGETIRLDGAMRMAAR
jgi:NAD(P)-dependent dehydrogenase (short-subunit alcohol dehydrogenase family)